MFYCFLAAPCERMLGASCYWQGMGLMTEEEAQMFCGLYGGHIVEVDSTEENIVIQEMRAGRYKIYRIDNFI